MQNLNSFLELTVQEEKILLPLVIKILEHRTSKEKVFSNTKIRGILNGFGYEITDAQIRKLVFYIRNEGIIELLIANHDGYFIANNIQDIREWMKRHKGKISAMEYTFTSIEKQFNDNMNKLKDGDCCLTGQITIFDVDNYTD